MFFFCASNFFSLPCKNSLQKTSLIAKGTAENYQLVAADFIRLPKGRSSSQWRCIFFTDQPIGDRIPKRVCKTKSVSVYMETIQEGSNAIYFLDHKGNLLSCWPMIKSKLLAYSYRFQKKM